MTTEQIIQRAVRLDAYWQSDMQNTELYLQALDAQLQAGRFAEMELLLQKPPQVLVSTPELQHWLGMYEIATGQFVAAEARFQVLVNANKDLVGPKENLGFSQAMQGKYAEAVATLSAIAADQLSIQGMHSLLRSCYWLGDLDAVIHRSVAWLQGLHPEDGHTAGMLALALVDVDQLDLAIPWAEHALQQGPNADAQNALGAAYLAHQDVDRAQVCFQQATKIDTRSGRAWFGLGVCFMASGNLSGAELCLRNAAVYFADYVGTWLMLAWHALSLQRLNDAEEYLQKALLLDAEYADTYVALALLSIAHEQLENAAKAIKAAKKLDPDNVTVKFVEAVYLDKIGDKKGAELLLASLDKNSMPLGFPLQAIRINAEKSS